MDNGAPLAMSLWPIVVRKYKEAEAMESAARIQLRRSKGWRKPPNTVVVSRPSKWGNPHRSNGVVSDVAAVEMFKRDLFRGRLSVTVTQVRNELAGKNLACWCKPGRRCHADVLLAVANWRGQPRVPGPYSGT